MATSWHFSRQWAEGSRLFAITREPIDLRALEAELGHPECGALVTFCGVVRERADDGQLVDGLRYEAHEAMALQTFAAIAQELQARYGELQITMVHRIGELGVGEIAVVVLVAAAHRAEAFAGCREAIDSLKLRCPIWKQERYRSGERRWIANDCGVRAP